MLESMGVYVSLSLAVAGAAHDTRSENYDLGITPMCVQSTGDSRQYGYYYMQEQIDKQKENKGIKRVMVVDDEDDINLVFKIVLEENGFKVDSFNNSLMALENFRSTLYDLVIIDIRMPVMNGYGLYQEIRKLDKTVKICFLTAGDVYYESFGKEAIPEFNENLIIRKPIDNEMLVTRLRSILD
jgi:CheY-like chemotaxis protein